MFYSKKLKKFSELNHCFFSRKGGHSKGLYKGLNCGRGSKDSKKNIFKNLDYVASKMSTKIGNLVVMYQTHSNKVLEINDFNFRKKIYSDAIITKTPGIALGVMTADCVPILIYNKTEKIVGCIHAGWKGAFSGIIKNTVLKIKKSNSKSKLYAGVGPCIGEMSYEVDFKFFKKFIRKSKNYKKYFKKKNKDKKFFNLRNFVADQLLDLNVIIDHVKHDTFKEKDYFFSYRRSKILKQRDYGRCISVIRLN